MLPELCCLDDLLLTRQVKQYKFLSNGETMVDGVDDANMFSVTQVTTWCVGICVHMTLHTEAQYCTIILKCNKLMMCYQVPCSQLTNYYDNKELIIVYFAVNEFFHNSLIMLLCIAKEVLFKQTASTMHRGISSTVLVCVSCKFS